MQIYGEVGPLPPGVVVVAKRSQVADFIVVVVSEAAGQKLPAQPGVLMGLFCDAVNALLEAPQDHGPVLVREPLRLVS